MTAFQHSYSQKFPLPQAYDFMNGAYHDMKKADAIKCIDKGHTFNSKEAFHIINGSGKDVVTANSAHDYWVKGTKYIESQSSVDSNGHKVTPDFADHTFSVEYSGDCL